MTTTRNSHQLTVDILDGLRLLWSGASDEAKPLLKAAMLEIKRLRATAGELAYHVIKDERVFTHTTDDGANDDRRFASNDTVEHHDTTD